MQTHDRMGQQFGNYRLIRLIGTGGHAQVYLAENVQIKNLQCAIKILTKVDLTGEKQARFRGEASIIANLQNLNPHIVQIYDFGIEESGVPYLAMEYAAEGTLRRLCPKNTPMALERIAFYTNQIADALQCAHNQPSPIVHCDIKPENMLLRSHDHVLLSDFGIATIGNTTSLTTPLKANEEILGTVAYMAPERFSEGAHRASDQYALGIVVYEWLSGSLPFSGTSDIEIAHKHVTMPPPTLRPRYPHVTKKIEDVVMRALAKEPDARHSTVQEFARALESAIQKAIHNYATEPLLPVSLQAVSPPPQIPLVMQPSLQQPAPPSSVPRSHEVKPPKPLWALVMLVLGLMLAVGVIGRYLVFPPSSSPPTAPISVSVSLAPLQPETDQIFRFNARLNLAAHEIDAAEKTIPASTTSPWPSQETSPSATTTGQVGCGIFGLGCQQAVSQDDVNKLKGPTQSHLESTISQRLQVEIKQMNGTPVSQVVNFTVSTSSDPAVGQPSNTVTVTARGQGQMEYVLNDDATELVRQLLVAQVQSQSLQMIDRTFHTKNLVIPDTNLNSSKISAVNDMSMEADAMVQFSQERLRTICTSLEGKSLANAEAFLSKLPGVDPTSIHIHFTSGSGPNLPNDLQHIKLILPDLTSLPVASPTVTLGVTPTASVPFNCTGEGQ